MTRHPLFTVACTLAVSLIVGAPAATPTDQLSTKPAEGLRRNQPDVFGLTNARIVVSPGRVIESGTIVVRGEKLASVAANADIPPEARVIDLAGKTVYPGLIDAYTEKDASFESNNGGAPYWNDQVRPQVSLAEQYQPESELNEKLRGQGVVARLVAPQGGVIRGTSIVVATGDGSPSETILNEHAAQHMQLTVARSRGGRRQYPNSPMGAVALARQALYDAQWYDRAWHAARADDTLPRPEKNDALAALQPVFDDRLPVVIDTSNELFFLRAHRFAEGFGLNLIVHGSGNEYRRLDSIRQTGRPVIVPVDFPQPPNVATVEAALDVRLESLMHWDLAPTNPARLEQAGVEMALSSSGLSDQKKFLEGVRKAVQHGLSQNAALKSLTVTPARLIGVDHLLGALEPGKLASFVVTDGELFDKNTKVVETWVAGRRYQIEKPPLRKVAGKWELALTKQAGLPETIYVTITGDDKLTAKVQFEQVGDADPQEVKLSHIELDDTRLIGTFSAKPFGKDGAVRFTLVVDHNSDSPALGHLQWPDGRRVAVSAKRVADNDAGDDPASEDEDENADESKSDESADEPTEPAFPVNYPLGAFGRTAPPEQPKQVMFRGATVWTCGPAGILKNASVLVGEGRILAVGTDVDVPEGTPVVDASGMHLSPGIIDCHSHMATDGGVNESGQAITAEVRIGDFIDCDDVNIYRQLAGGVTSSNILHGSANPIGGQNQVIKLRWGALDEEMKFREAPQGIKFALGENVKQSNWGDDYTSRYPQTRMGVEQLFRDEFLAAREYRQRWDEWRQTGRGLPPRRDLELDAVSEILQKSRWIHCHSYRQDEILALIRVLDEFDITIGTFQHILEGYKVADAMKKHGAMGSAFSDWWAYKFEVYDAIPYAGALMHQAGVVVSFNSDDRELARHLNQEAAKAVKYGGVKPEEALKFVTLNPARQLRIDKYVGSIETGKHADLVLWSDSPLSNFARCEQTWIDGRKYFDREEDRELRSRMQEMRSKLIQRILASGEKMREPGMGDGDPAELWPREDLFCGHSHDHDHGGFHEGHHDE